MRKWITRTQYVGYALAFIAPRMTRGGDVADEAKSTETAGT